MHWILPHFGTFAAASMLGLRLPGTYNPTLVILCISIAVFAGYAALGCAGQISVSKSAIARPSWLATGSIAMGIGICAMHFIGMLAFSRPIPVSYDLVITVSSMIPATLASFLVLHLMSRERKGVYRLILGSVLMGSGIGLMHYTGMAAMGMDGLMLYDPMLFIGSVLVAVEVTTMVRLTV